VIGTEFANHTQYLLGRADTELSVKPRLGALARRFAPLYVSIFGVPEVGVQVRIFHALRQLPPDVESLVDLGCGSGMLLGAIHRRQPTSALTGIEIDEESASLATTIHPYAKIVTTDIVHGEVQATFSCCVCIDVLEHISDTELPIFVASLSRLIDSGGKLVLHVPASRQRRFFKRFSSWEHHDHEREGFAPDELRKLFVNAGFDDVQITPTFGPIAALAWELNMIISAKPIQAPLFPLLVGIAWLGEQMPFRKGNGLLLTARKP
jgi:SAM-dependent methyltransferase